LAKPVLAKFGYGSGLDCRSVFYTCTYSTVPKCESFSISNNGSKEITGSSRGEALSFPKIKKFSVSTKFPKDCELAKFVLVKFGYRSGVECRFNKKFTFYRTMSSEDAEMRDLLSGAWCGFTGPGNPPTMPPPPPPPDAPPPPPVITTAPPRSPPLPRLGNRSEIMDTDCNSEVDPVESVKSDSHSQSRYGTDHDITIMGTDSTYVQCKSARAHSLKQNTLDCTMGTYTGTVNKVQHERVGSLAFGGDSTLNKTFRGSRITTGDRVVNQNISISFDPLTMICTCCTTQHSIVPTDGTGLAIAVTDQNFNSSITGRSTCIPIIRVEDATLHELFEFTLEIFSRTALPTGTLFLVSTVSHLAKVGTTIYCLEWQRLLHRFGERWPNCRVGPLPPILREDTCGEIGRSLVVLQHWFSTVYTGVQSILYPKEAWDWVVRALTRGVIPPQDLDHVDISTTALPATLTSDSLHPLKISKSSSHAVTAAYDGEATHELILALLNTLSTQFGTRANPEDLLVREPAESVEGVKDTPTAPMLIVVGASHMKRVVPHIPDTDYNVVDLSQPGWTATDRNIKQITDDIVKLGDITGAVGILDLVSNTTFRYENSDDGSLTLPYKHDGKYHMDGRVTTCTKESLNSTLAKTLPIFDAIPGLKIVVPPLPRYLQTPCCESEGHCDGIQDADYVTDLMSKTLGVKRQIRDFVVSKGTSNCWVPDVVRQLVPEGTTTQEIGVGFGVHNGPDGVHLMPESYVTLSEILLETVRLRTVANSNIAGKTEKGRSHYWRGFTSPVGSARTKNTAANYKEHHAGGGKWRENRFFTSTTNRSARGRGSAPGPSGRFWN
jgi:hypothetical protein